MDTKQMIIILVICIIALICFFSCRGALDNSKSIRSLYRPPNRIVDITEDTQLNQENFEDTDSYKGQDIFKQDANWGQLQKIKGYPVPQGKLSNFNYGDKSEFREKSIKEWNNVLNTDPNIEHFRAPRPNTRL